MQIVDIELFFVILKSKYQGVAGANAQHILSVRDLSPEFVLSSETFTTASVVVKVFFYMSHSVEIIAVQEE